MTVTATMLEQAERARAATAARPPSPRPVPAFTIAPFETCPGCGCAAQPLQRGGVVDVECHYCGAVHSRDVKSKTYLLMPRRLDASDPPRSNAQWAAQLSNPDRPWGAATREF